MYSPVVTALAVERLQAALDKENRAKHRPLWNLEYHTIPQVDRTVKHFQDLVDLDRGTLRRPLKPDEERWIRNERAICQADFNYWSSRYAFIRTTDERLIRFSPNVAQQIVNDFRSDLELAGKSISMQDLKARQLGISTDTEMVITHRVVFYPNVNAVVASSDPQKSMLMAQIMERAIDNLPWWMAPRMTSHKKGELIEFGGQDSGITIQHGTQVSGIARGSSPSIAHLSELIDFDNPEQLVDASLFRAMHESPWLVLILESTALGRGNWWHDTWKLSKEGYKLGLARLFPVFLPWFVGVELYPNETWIRNRPVPQNWKPEGITLRHADRAAAYVESNQNIQKYLGKDWRMPVEQMWFWEVTRYEYKEKGLLAQFYSEMPADDIEAFQSNRLSVFDAEILSVYRENTGKRPEGVFGITGPGVPLRLQPDRRDVDKDRPAISIDADYKFVPLLFSAGGDPQGKLFIWEWPKPNFEHGIGVDTADGVSQDSSVIQVVRKGDFVLYDDVQCAEFAASEANSADLAPIAYAILKFYSVRVRGQERQAKAVIECAGNGSNTQHELRKMGWRNFHQWVHYDAKKMDLNRAQRIGWYTNAWSRPMMMDYLIKALRDGAININSPWFVDEMGDLSREIDAVKISAAANRHDDRIMALGIVWFSLHIMELIGPTKSALQRRQRGPDTALVYPRYKPDFQAMGEGQSIWVPPGEEEYIPSNPYEVESEFPEWAR